MSPAGAVSPADTTVWVHVALPWAAFGVAHRGGVVVDAAPIAAWMVGKPVRRVQAWLERRGAVCTRLSGP